MGIKQTFFLILLTLMGTTIVVALISHSLGMQFGGYVLAIVVPTILILYVILRARDEKLSISSMTKRILYGTLPKYIKGESNN